MSKNQHTETCRDETGHCHIQRHRENPGRPYVYPSPNKNGFWRATIIDAEDMLQIGVGDSAEEAFDDLKLVAKYWAAA